MIIPVVFAKMLFSKQVMHFNVTHVTFGATLNVFVCQTLGTKICKIFPTAFHGFVINVFVQILVVPFLLLHLWIYQISF